MTDERDVLDGLKGYTPGPWHMVLDIHGDGIHGADGRLVIGTCSCCGLSGYNEDGDWPLIYLAPELVVALRSARERIAELEARLREVAG
jgi:hypothetical protein